jgi:hypothetical protein
VSGKPGKVQISADWRLITKAAVWCGGAKMEKEVWDEFAKDIPRLPLEIRFAAAGLPVQISYLAKLQ